ncbi:MAG: putative selenium-dependent hydroxylase accessory protein YqeC [Chloroflexi bacterium]|nr:putative selenium-dependent hydroxylase accessory protein YqeC [Chloroflexota bacterium]
MRLFEALGVQRGDVVAFTGGGGKTSAMIRLGNELKEEGWRVLATTTTRLAESEMELFPFATRWRANLLRGSRELAQMLDEHGFVFVYQQIRSDKVMGIPDEYVSRLVDEMNADVLLVEADGARRLPLKAPRSYEPVWPLDTTIGVVVAGMDILGQPLDEHHVYNPQPILDRYGFPYEAPIQPAWLAQILRDERLGLKDIPPTARAMVLLNKADSPLLEARARRTAQIILRQPRVDGVAIGNVHNPLEPVIEVQQRIAAIILAGGMSRRMGTSKVLLPWGDRTVIEGIIQTLLPFRLADIVVVTGHKAGAVERVLQNYPVRTVYNPMYAKGEMLSSLKSGLRALKPEISAALVVLGDQPQISARVVRHILTTAAQRNDTLVAPYYQGQRGHPILIPRRYWRPLLKLRKGAPRDIINQQPITCVSVDNDSILRDIDTPEKYAQEKRLAGLE